MAGFVVVGVGEVCASFQQAAYIPDDVKKNMLNAEADIIVKAQSAAAPRNTGTLAKSIQKRAPLVTWDGGYIVVAPDGVHHTNKSGESRYRNRGERNKGETENGEVAFIHEYGAPMRNIYGQLWMLKANDANADKAVDAAAPFYNDWLAKCEL